VRDNKCAVVELSVPFSPCGCAVQMTTVLSYSNVIIWNDLPCLDIML